MVKLPDSGILLHVGPPKTGTTSIQRACFRKKSELRELGILYPGHNENHNIAVARPAGYTDDLFAPPDLSYWQALVSEVRLEKHKVIVSSELLSNASADAALRIVEELGKDRVHVLLSIRPLAFLFPSIWQQGIKSGFTEQLDTWMRDILRGPSATREQLSDPWLLADFANAVLKWKNIVGANRLSVLIVEPEHPVKLIHGFEDIVSLPRGFLVNEDKKQANRSLTYHEAEFLRHINMRIRGNELHSHQIFRTLPLDAIIKFVRRIPGPDEERTSLPAEMLEEIVVFAKEMRDQIVASGANIIGDINNLMKVPTARPAGSVCGLEVKTISEDMVKYMLKTLPDRPSKKEKTQKIKLIINKIKWVMKIQRPASVGNCESWSKTLSMDVAVSMVEDAIRVL